MADLPGGRGGPALARAASGGAPVDLRAPSGSFVLSTGGFRPVVLVGAGTGVAPLVAMARAHLDRGTTMPPLWLLTSTPTPVLTPLRAETEALFASHRDLHLRRWYTRVGADDLPAGARAGRMDAVAIIETLAESYVRLGGHVMAAPWFESDAYVCGPPGFVAAVRDGLVAAGADADQVAVEEFSPGAVVVAGGARTAPETALVRFTTRGTTARWVRESGQSLLETGEVAGLDLPHDCRSGTCRSCELVLLVGEVAGPVETGADGVRRVLACSGRPRLRRGRAGGLTQHIAPGPHRVRRRVAMESISRWSGSFSSRSSSS